MRDGTELEVKIRLGEPELIKEAGSRALGLRVLKDHRAARDLHVGLRARRDGAAGARDASRWRRWPSPIPPGDLPAREEMAREVPDLDLWDEALLSVDVAEAIRRARVGEAAARKLDARITNSDGAVFGSSVGASAFATSAGFSGSNRGTHVSLRTWSRSPTTRAARSATGRTGRRRATSARCSTPRRSGSRRRGARSPSSARARSRPARCRWSSRPRRRAACSASSRA